MSLTTRLPRQAREPRAVFRAPAGGSDGRAVAACLLAAILLVPGPAEAVIIQTVSGSGNTTAPADDPGWGNVSSSGNGTAIYLGDHWMITANHVNIGTVTLGGQSFSVVPGSTVRLTNGGAPGRSAFTDLKMFRIDGTPVGVPDIRISSTTPAVSTPVTMIGAGRNRGAFTRWNVNQATNPWTWTITGSGGNFAGYQTLTSRAVRWGTNEVDATGIWVNDGSSDIYSLSTIFDEQPGSSEAQAVYGDSGGGLFVKAGSVWQLAGVIYTVDGYSGQPNVAATPVFGNETFMADLSYYRPQILVYVPEPTTLGLAVLAVATLAVGRARHRRRLTRY